MMISTPPHISFTIPDLPALCPFPVRDNVHYAQAASESLAWIQSTNVLSDKKFDTARRATAGLLASHAYYYYPDFERFRTCCDFLNILYVLDVTSDYQNAQDAGQTGHVFIEALRDPNFNDGSALCAMAKAYVAQAHSTTFSMLTSHPEDSACVSPRWVRPAIAGLCSTARNIFPPWRKRRTIESTVSSWIWNHFRR